MRVCLSPFSVWLSLTIMAHAASAVTSLEDDGFGTVASAAHPRVRVTDKQIDVKWWIASDATATK